MKKQNLKTIAILIAVTVSLASVALQAAPRRYYYEERGGSRRRPDRSYRYVDKRVRHDHRVKVEVKRPHRDLYTALDVINTVANVVDAFTPDAPTVVQTNTVAPVAPTYPTPQPTYQPQYVQPTYQEPIVQPQYVQPPVVETNTIVQPSVQTQPVYTQSQVVVPPAPVVVQPTPVVVPQPVVTTPPAYVQPQVQNNTTIVVPPANPRPYRRPFLPPRYYNRPIRRW